MTQPIRWLQDEIAERMLQKLDIVKLDVKSVLVVPDFPGKHHRFLGKRFPNARIHSCVEEQVSRFDLWITKAVANLSRVFGGSSNPLNTFLSSGKFDLPDNSVDLVFSNLLLQDLPDPRHFLQECWRVLKEGGLITFSYLGPDTGKELRGLSELKLKNLLSPWDMHDMGDALVAERFSDPVMDMEFLTLDYEAQKLLLEDALALKLLQMPTAAKFDQAIFPKKMTLELVYGHAWAIGKHLAKAQNNIAYIDLNQIGRKTRRDSD